jgi:hypothetical protein
MVFDLNNPKEAFAYWIQERWEILKRREAGQPKPWSKDKIFRSVYFTNVRREDDRTTKYIREWAKEVHPDLLIPAYVLARTLNRAETLNQIWAYMAHDREWRPEAVKAVLQEYRDDGNQVFSGAYLITTCGVKMDKLDYVVRVAEHAATRKFTFESCEDTHRDLMTVNGLGSFLAAQVVADLKNTEGHPLQKADDWWGFVASGPGSRRGVNYYYGRHPEHPFSEMYFRKFIHTIREETAPMLDGVPEICNQDLQNCLCEFSKYMRVKAGGRTKRNYPGA